MFSAGAQPEAEGSSIEYVPGEQHNAQRYPGSGIDPRKARHHAQLEGLGSLHLEDNLGEEDRPSRRQKVDSGSRDNLVGVEGDRGVGVYKGYHEPGKTTCDNRYPYGHGSR